MRQRKIGEIEGSQDRAIAIYLVCVERKELCEIPALNPSRFNCHKGD